MSNQTEKMNSEYKTGLMIDVKKFGAKGDGVSLDTNAIQTAIDSLQQGETLVFANGIYVTGTLRLKSNIRIVIEKDAELCASRNLAHYRANDFYHNEMIDTVSLLYAIDCENITIEGEGKIQLSGDAFADFCSMRQVMEIEEPLYIEQTVVTPKERPTQPIFFHDCRNIQVRGLKIFNSPCWTLVFSDCENILVEHIYMDNHNRIPNNDGIHCSASKHIVIKNCTFLCGDDCFAATCITDWNGICEDIEISDCLMSSRSAAIRLGHLESHVRNIRIRDIKILPSNRGVAIFAENGGCVENVIIENIDAETKTYAGAWWGKGEGIVLCTENSDGIIKDVTFKNCSFVESAASVICGGRESIHNVQLQSCTFVNRPNETHLYYKHKLDLQPNVAELQDAPYALGETLYIKDGCCKNLILKDCIK